jgi:hypothetical protein
LSTIESKTLASDTLLVEFVDNQIGGAIKQLYGEGNSQVKEVMNVEASKYTLTLNGLENYTSDKKIVNTRATPSIKKRI